MDGRGQVVARRAGSPGASDVPPHMSSFAQDLPPGPAVRTYPTPMVAAAATDRNSGLLPGLDLLPTSSASAPKALLEASLSAGSEPAPGKVRGTLSAASVPEALREASLSAGSEPAPGKVRGTLSAEPPLSAMPALEAALREGAAATDLLRSIAAGEARLFGFC